jgi:phage terminase large subunit-like protein
MTTLTTLSRLSAPPRYATKRNPTLGTLGPHADQVAAALGHPSMPWQSMVNAVANEVMEDGSFRYPVVVLSTPRQAGKTTLLNGILAHRCITLPDFRAYYTAQTGSDARFTWGEWQRNLASRMPDRWKFRFAAGEETATWKSNGSTIRTFPPTAEALHGKQTDFVALDEVFALSMERGASITQAIVPTQATRPRRQYWIVSTAGTTESQWFRGWIDKARASLQDPDSRICYFEWSAPEDMPWDDPETWAATHPAFGRTIAEDFMADQVELIGEDQFRRAFLNQWPVMGADWQTEWANLDTTTPIPRDAVVHIAADGAWNHRHSSIAAAALLPDGRVSVEVIEQREGTAWLVERLTEVSRRHRCQVVIAKTGPLGFLIDDLTRAGVRVAEAGAGDYAEAIARFQTLVSSGKLCHPGDPRLDLAVANVASSAGERVTWKRRSSGVDISPLTATAFAAWRASAPGVRPRVRAI